MDRSMEPTCTWEEDGEDDLRKHGRAREARARAFHGVGADATAASDVYNAGLYQLAQHGDPRDGRVGVGSEGAAQISLDDQAAINAALDLDEAAATSAAGAGQRRPVGFANTANCFAGLADNDEDVVREDEEEVPLKRISTKKQKVRAPGSAEKTRAGEAKPDQADERESVSAARYTRGGRWRICCCGTGVRSVPLRRAECQYNRSTARPSSG